MKNRFATWVGLTISTIVGTELFNKSMSFYRGNSTKISSKNILFNNESTLKHKKICFLGSSITYGAGSFGDSFPDYLAAKDGVEVVKEAVSGTTLGGSTEGTYTSRLKNNIPMDEDFDLFVNFRLMTVVLVSQLVKSVIHFHLMILIEILLLALWNILLPMSSKSGSAL